MKHLLLASLLLFALNSCGEDEQKLAQQSKQLQETQAQKEALLAEIKAKDTALAKAREDAKAAQAKLLIEEEAKKEAFLEAEKIKAETKKRQIQEAGQNTQLAPVGVEVNEHKITIDTQKTKDFLQQLGKTFENKINKMTQDLEKGIVDEKDAGIKIDDTRINIDLNKTKDVLETWAKKMQGFVQTFDSMAKEVDTQAQQIQNTQPKGQ